RRRAAAAPQPIDSQRRRLEHDRRRAGGGRSSVRAAFGPELPSDRRSLIAERQPVRRHARRVGPRAVAALRRLPRRLGRGAVPADADGAGRDRARRNRTPASDPAVTRERRGWRERSKQQRNGETERNGALAMNDKDATKTVVVAPFDVLVREEDLQ